MKILGVIPARYASTRLPGKPLIDIGGKTMIQRVYEQAQQSLTLTQVIVATDDQRIYDTVAGFGGAVVMTAPDHQNGTGRCAEVLAKTDQAPDVIINIQGDEPFIQPDQIDTLAGLFSNEKCSIGTLIKKSEDMELLQRPSIIKATVDKDLRALYFSRSVIPFRRNPDLTTTYYKHIGIYGYRAEVLREIVKLPPSPLELTESLEQLRWLENGYTIYTALTDHESIAVDVPEDVERVRSLI
ncbi:MAG: 3-deoxy-manno-octulosonate cytidylyltransferase [Bacteroidetes bacterium]|nr:3-deoxy-manno-octulosonate cytidylyltransferase [Bacteroidota bacterium]